MFLGITFLCMALGISIFIYKVKPEEKSEI